jgi:ATP-dependent helicase/nuclease subunit A
MDNNDKVKKFLDKLEKWRDKSEYLTVSELLWYLYDETGYFSFVGAMPDGEQRQANLRLLFERARQYEQTSFKGLFNFINFINRLKSSSGDMGSAKILGENQNVVRIMSIHKSKGLEFPVVFVSGCGKKFNLQDANAPILFDQDLGLGPDLVDVRRRISYSTAAKQALVYKMKLETLSEEMRILYVAFTRAKEKLIITSTIKDAQKTAIKWCNAASYGKKLLEYETLKARSFIDWIGPAISWHSDSQIIRDSAGASSCEELDEVGVNLKLSIYSKMDLCFSNLNKIPGTESEVADAGCEEEIERENKYFDEIKKENKYFDEIKRRLEWKYKHEAATRLPTKLSVTELKRRFSPIDDETEIVFKNNENFEKNVIIPLPNRPAFLEGRKELTAAEKGTTLHFVMQHLKLENEMTEPIIVRQVEEMVKGEMLSENQAKTVDFKRISRFFDGQLGKRMLAAGSINREVPFNLELSCNDASLLGINMLNDELGENETVLVQGVIDCFFEEDDELVLIDYKTDYIAPYGKETLSDKYRLQIELYSRALKIAFNKNIKGKYIYLFHNGDIIEYM